MIVKPGCEVLDITAALRSRLRCPFQHKWSPSAWSFCVSWVQVDPHLSPKVLGKVEDDIPALYKRLRYPFQISKSALFAVGSPHTWPGLLAALAWLVELLSYSDKAVSPAPSQPPIPAWPGPA